MQARLWQQWRQWQQTRWFEPVRATTFGAACGVAIVAFGDWVLHGGGMTSMRLRNLKPLPAEERELEVVFPGPEQGFYWPVRSDGRHRHQRGDGDDNDDNDEEHAEKLREFARRRARAAAHSSAAEAPDAAAEGSANRGARPDKRERHTLELLQLMQREVRERMLSEQRR